MSIDSNEGYFKPNLGDVISGEGSRYVVVEHEPLGVGVFSVVWPVADRSNKLIALKVVRWQDHFRKYADKEVEISRRVSELADKDPAGSGQCAMLREHFVHQAGEGRQHLCMAFEKLDRNLRSAGKQPLDKVLRFGKQVLLALRYLHEQVGLVHCDVKPDNLLLRWDGLSVKLCDFGTARYPPELQAVDELQPLFYRAPEVFIGATRGRKIDIWSAGCTIYELAVGRILFRSCNTPREVVEKIMQLRGPIPQAVRDQGRLAPMYFSNRGFHPEVGAPVDPEKAYKKTPMTSEIGPHIDFGKAHRPVAHEQAKAQLSKLIGKTTVIGAAMKHKSSVVVESEKKLKLLCDLIERLMDVNPATRISAAGACEHGTFSGVELPPAVDLQEAPPLPEEAPPPLPPQQP